MSDDAEPADKQAIGWHTSEEKGVSTRTVHVPGYPYEVPERIQALIASEATSLPETTSSEPSEDEPAERAVANRGASTRKKSVSGLSPLDRFEAFVLGMIVGCNILLVILYVLTEHGWSFN